MSSETLYDILKVTMPLNDLEVAKRRIEDLFNIQLEGRDLKSGRVYTGIASDGSEISLQRNWDEKSEEYDVESFREHGVWLWVENPPDVPALQKLLEDDPVLQANFVWRRVKGEGFPPPGPPSKSEFENWSLFGLREPVERMPELAAEFARVLQVPLERIDSPRYGPYFRTFDHQFRSCWFWTGVGPMWEIIWDGLYPEFPMFISMDDYHDLERLDRLLFDDGFVDAELLQRRIGPIEDDDEEYLDDDANAESAGPDLLS